MYIYIFKDGTIKKATSVTEDDMANVEDGILDILDITGCRNPKYLVCLDEWDDIESAD